MEASAGRVTRALAYGWVCLLTLLITAPTLAPGFVLSYDLVFTPRQDLLPASLGLGGSLPRAVPQDAVVALVETVLPGQLLEKAVLIAVPLVAGLGMLRLLRGCPWGARVIAATLAMWNPWVAERLVIGHWGLLLAYALVPWALASALDMRRGVPGAGLRLVLQVAAAGLTPSGGLLAVLLAVPIAVGPGGRARPWSRVGVAAASIATWIPWALPALLHPAVLNSDPMAADVFGLRAEAGGVLLTSLGLGGIWNAEVVPASRTWPSAPVLAFLVVLLAAYGFPEMTRRLGRAAAWWWGACAVAGVVASWASAWVPGPWGSLLASVPGGGLLRDSHKLLAPLALLLAVAAALGVMRLCARISDRATRAAVVAAAVLVPIALLPDLAWGVAGRLSPVDYPPAWSTARERLLGDARSGDVLVLPWSAFRRFDFNDRRTVLDPAPRWLPRTTVVDDGLAVATPAGIVSIEGEDPRAQAVSRLLADGGALAEGLPGLGIGWVLVEEGQLPEIPPGALTGLAEVPVGDGLRLYAVPRTMGPPVPPAGLGLVVGADLGVVLLLAGCAIAAAAGPVRRRREFPPPGGRSPALVP